MRTGQIDRPKATQEHLPLLGFMPKQAKDSRGLRPALRHELSCNKEGKNDNRGS